MFLWPDEPERLHVLVSAFTVFLLHAVVTQVRHLILEVSTFLQLLSYYNSTPSVQAAVRIQRRGKCDNAKPLSENNRPWDKLAMPKRFIIYLTVFHNDLAS